MTGSVFGNLDEQLEVEGRQDVTIFPDMFINISPFSGRQVITMVINYCRGLMSKPPHLDLSWDSEYTITTYGYMRLFTLSNTKLSE